MLSARGRRTSAISSEKTFILHTVSVGPGSDWLMQRYAIASNDSSSVHVAVWGFLSVLERADYQRRRMRQECVILWTYWAMRHKCRARWLELRL